LLGYGIFTRQAFESGDFVVEYSGDLIDQAVANEKDDQTFIYYFSLGSHRYRYVQSLFFQFMVCAVDLGNICACSLSTNITSQGLPFENER